MVLLDDQRLHFFNTTFNSFFERQELHLEQRATAYANQQRWINAKIREAKGKLR